MYELSILIPARNEIFLPNTVEDIFKNSTRNTEVIVVLDGYKIDLVDNPRLTVIYHSKPVGQRAATNEACRLSQSKYVMKVDAHCSFAYGFDDVLLNDIKEDWTIVPTMRNLHAFDWVCSKCGNRRYQGPTPTSCPDCDNTVNFEKDILWIAKESPQSNSYCFDPTPHFQYFRSFEKRKEGQGKLTESMSLQGSCFMLSREKYWELDICDESFGSWGSQGIEVAVKTWLSGGKVIVDHNTYYAHMFRTQGGDFSFPYPLSGKQVEHAKSYARELFFSNKWPKQKYPLSWLVRKFWPVEGWTQEDLDTLEGKVSNMDVSKGIVYYTDSRGDEEILESVRKQLLKQERKNTAIVSVSLKELDFGQNYVLDLERGYLTMFKQILKGLEELDTDVVYFCEHDVLYHPSHFNFIPPRKDTFYYNENVYKVNSDTGQALFYYCKQTSGLVAYRTLLLEHYRKRVERVEKEGKYDRAIGFEPGTHSFPRGIDTVPAEKFMSEFPNVDIRHHCNLTPSRWSKDQFRNQKYTEGWTMTDEIPGWGKTKGRFKEFLKEVVNE